MNSDREQQIEDLFTTLADLPPSQQGPLLESLCGDDRQLVDHMLALLQADASGGHKILSFDASQMASQLFDPDSPPVIPGRFGRYVLRKYLGHGGMGWVYLAERDGLGDQVAVKFLHHTWSSPGHRIRFEREQRTLAGLNHPCIARLYDAGATNGTPWFAMEYVDGVPIIEFCQRHGLDFRARLKLFRDVCEAVKYAHRQLTVHLDLKPSNILVTAGGDVKLLDFGIAKNLNAEGSADKTQTGLRLLSLNYAAPEQIRGEAVDVQTDIHGLGVILYELLTGRTPADLTRAGPVEIARYTEEEVERPSLAVRGNADLAIQASKSDWRDLDVLCLTALHRDRALRYESVEALIRDVDHFLGGWPLEARRESLTHRWAKFIRRNRKNLVISSTAVVILLALTAFYTIRLASSRNAALNAVARTQRLQRFTLRLMEGYDKSTSPPESLSVLTLVDRGVQEAQMLDREPEMQAELFQMLGGIYQKLGKFDRADDLFGRALNDRTSLLGPEHPETAQSLIDLGLLRLDQGRFEQAEHLIHDAKAKLEHSQSSGYEERAKANFALGKVLEARGNYSAAIPLLTEAAKLQSDSKASIPDTSATLKELADAHFYAGHYDLCEKLTRQTMGMHRQFYGERHPSVADDLINLGAIQAERGRFTDAEQFYRRALVINRAWYGDNHPQTASNIYMLGQALLEEKRYDEAEIPLRQALAIQEKIYGPNHPHVANVMNELCILEDARNRLREAGTCYDRVTALYRAAYGDRHYLVGLALANRASLRLTEKDYVRAEAGFRDALAHYGQVLPADHLYVGVTQIKLGKALLYQKRYVEAEEQTLAGYKIVKAQTTPTVSWLQTARKDLVAIYEHLGKHKEAASFRAEL